MRRLLWMLAVITLYVGLRPESLWSSSSFDKVAFFLKVEGIDRIPAQISFSDRDGKKLSTQATWDYYDEAYWLCWLDPGEYIIKLGGGRQEKLLLLPYTNTIMSLDTKGGDEMKTDFPIKKLHSFWIFRFGMAGNRIGIHVDTGRGNWLLVTDTKSSMHDMFRILCSCSGESVIGNPPVSAWDLSRLLLRAETNIKADPNQTYQQDHILSPDFDLNLIEVQGQDRIEVFVESDSANRERSNYSKIVGYLLEGRIGRMQSLATELGPVLIYAIKEKQ